MKIRTYKGQSLEALYQCIQKDLGPDAVVVHRSPPGGIQRLLGRGRHELVAAVDDGSFDSHVLSRAASTDDVNRLLMEQTEQWKEMKDLFRDMKKDVKDAAWNGVPYRGTNEMDLPEFAVGWDARFLSSVSTTAPEILNEKRQARGRQALSRMLHVDESFSVAKHDGRPHVIALTGPTGAGKTTTLAKLASRWCLEEHLDVGLISTDTYRVAAVDQIREYATLLGLELRVACSANEAASAIDEFQHKDVILVDTPGRNHHDRTGMTKLRGSLSSMQPDTVMLLIPAALDGQQVSEVVRNFQALGPTHLVITKVDEVRRFHVFTTVTCDSNCPVVFLTNGQRVPRDIKAARASEMAKMLMGAAGQGDNVESQSDSD